MTTLDTDDINKVREFLRIWIDDATADELYELHAELVDAVGPPARHYFSSDEHALYAGWVIGQLLRSEVAEVLEIEADDDCNYTGFVSFTLPISDVSEVRMRVRIAEPPIDWTLT